MRGRIRAERDNPVAAFVRTYRPVIRATLQHPRTVLVVGFSLLLLTVLPVQRLALGRTLVPFPQIESEFMPPLWEGDVLYMPTMRPGVSAQQAKAHDRLHDDHRARAGDVRDRRRVRGDAAATLMVGG